MSASSPMSRLYLPLLVFGGLAGFGFWVLSEAMTSSLLNERSLLFAASAGGALSFFVLSLFGGRGGVKACLWSTLVALGLGAALWWAAGRHDTMSGFFNLLYPQIGFTLILLIATPFLAASGEGAVTRYATLFLNSWQIVVRHVVALFFTLMFWGLLTMSDAILRLVGLELIAVISAQSLLAWGLSGAVYGLAMGVARSFSDDLSPLLAVQLLRFFLPLVLAVSVVFIVAVPLRGWEDVLQGLSAASILIGFCLAALLMISAGIDAGAKTETKARFMRICVALMALVLPALAGLAAWAIWLRVAQYGWTPERLMAATMVAVLLIYGVAYALSVVLQGDWMARIREVNTGLAVACMVVALIWFTPFVVPERIAALSQSLRAIEGASARELPLRELAGQWGRAGQSALVQLEEMRPDLQAAIAKAKGEVAFDPPGDMSAQEAKMRKDLAALLPVYPKQDLPAGALDELVWQDVSDWLMACQKPVSNGPGCAVVLADFGADLDKPAGVVLLRDTQHFVSAFAISMRDGKLLLDAGKVGNFSGPSPNRLAVPDLEALHQGRFEIAPIEVPSLKLNDHSIFVHN